MHVARQLDGARKLLRRFGKRAKASAAPHDDGSVLWFPIGGTLSDDTADALEEESLQDQDYYIDAATIDLVADGKATDHLVHLLRSALGSAGGIDIRWARR